MSERQGGDSEAVIEAPSWWRKAWALAPRSLRTRDWAEQHIIVLPPSAKPGPFRLATNPMLGCVLDLFDHPGVRETAGMKGVQSGISFALQVRVAKRAHTAPCQMLLVLPSKDAGRQQMKKRWRPLLTGKGCPVLRQFQRRRRPTGRPKRAARANDRDSVADETDRTTYDNIVFTNGFDLLLGSSGSVQSLASNSCEEVQFDEVDKFNDWDGDEASPVELGRVRTETFQDIYKLNQISTPTVDTGNIAVAFYASDIRLYPFVPCPCCGRPVQLLFENIRWDLPPEREMPDQAERARLLIRDPHRVWLECDECHGKIFEADRLRLLARGWLGTLDQGWQLHADGREVGAKPWGTTVGYHFPTMASALGMGLNAIAAEWVGAAGSIDRIKKAKTQHHGVPFVLDLVKPAKGLLWPKVHDDPERGFVAPPGWRIPAWASRVFLIVDTQKDKFYWLIRAYGRRRRSRLIAYGEARSFEDLERLESLRIDNEDPALPSRGIFLTAIDSGGGIDLKKENLTRTRQVYQWCAANPRTRLALKGVTSNKYDTITKLGSAEYQSPTTQEKVRVHLLWVKPLDSGDNLADTIRQQIDAFDPATGELLVDPLTGEARKTDLWELNRDVRGDYVGHLEVMQRKQIKKHGKAVTIWVEQTEGARHDWYDGERYAEALSHDANVGCEALPSEADLRSRAAVATQQHVPRARPATGATTPDGRAFLANRR